MHILGDQGDSDLRAQALIGLGHGYGAQRKNKEAISYYQQAEKIALSKELRRKAQDGIKLAKQYIERDAKHNSRSQTSGSRCQIK